VRIANTAMVRHGAYLTEGTTVMHYGFVNYNAGTLGPCMVEGNIPQGVVVGAGTDVGAYAGIIGTLSGGGKEKIVIGRECFLAAHSETGISLGYNCAVGIGTCFTDNTPVVMVTYGLDEEGQEVPKRSYGHKAREFNGHDHMTIRTNSETGEIEVLVGKGHNVKLNLELHTNQ
jgi:2,3,4,5-tetrahydropyridine-2-carboxylate N-succinyltransferase